MSIARTTNREQKASNSPSIFNAVLDLCMSGQGYSSVSLRQVTREVGVVLTAFYRHFDDMESLGKALVEDELGGALATLREHMQLGVNAVLTAKLPKCSALLRQSMPSLAIGNLSPVNGLVAPEAVRRAINEQINTFAKIMSADLVLQPAFEHINSYDRYLLAETGVNLSFHGLLSGWI